MKVILKYFVLFLSIVLVLSCEKGKKNEHFKIKETEDIDKGIYIEQKTSEDTNVILNCNVINGNKYYNIIIGILPEYKLVHSIFQKYENDIEIDFPGGYSRVIDLFDFDLLLESLNSYLISQGENNKDIQTILELISLKRDIVMSITKQYDSRIFRVNGIVLDYRNVEDSKYFLWCHIYYDTYTVPYYYEVIISAWMYEEYGFINCKFDQISPDSDSSDSFSKDFSEFSYDMFLDRLKTYLINNEENSDHINIIINLLSYDEDVVMSKIDKYVKNIRLVRQLG